ncbi:RCC1 and BTB domain-containing protein 2-like [Dermatophagoides farinae]|uniref:RCC1 and BTB domain-containing protein 2-like n=1 Tax=Dermatophagoides farinae TaxID=6954 RepID=UPI003F62B9B3
MTEEATFAYGEEICSWLSLKHDMTKPQRISCLDDMKIFQVDSGWNFVAFLTEDGRVYLASKDSNWQTNNTCRLISTGNDRFKMIACGYKHLLLLRQDGVLFAMGDNSYGQITGNEKSSYERMIQIEDLKNVELIVCGRNHSLALTNAGKIYSWGRNDFGQLGLGDKKNRNTPCLVPYPILIHSRIKDIVAETSSTPQIPSTLKKIPIKNVRKIACSKFHFFSFAHDGSSYYAWGETKNSKWSSPRKLDGRPKSFSAASSLILGSAITFGLKSRINVYKYHEPISTKSIIRLFNNPDNYDVKFVIGDRRILACKCYLKSVSDYYCLMFSGDWKEKVEVEIRDYSYETYYAYLRMLHYDCIEINRNIISQLIDLATCYIDKRLIKHCKTFIRNDLNEQTMPTYLQLISKYEMKELYDKLSHITIEQVLPKVTDSILQNNENSIEFLKSIYDQQQLFLRK